MATKYSDDAVTHIGVDKISRYGWRIKNEPGELQYIEKSKLVVGAEYQRDGTVPASQDKILRIARDWDWMACGVIVVAKVSGKFRVIDGQHRALGSRKRSDIAKLPCLVFEPESIAQEARAFLALNTLNKPVSAFDKHRARLVAEDEISAKIDETLRRLGLVLSKRAKSVGHFGSIAWAYRRAAEDYQAFDYVVDMAAKLSSADGIAVPERLLDGLWYLNQTMEGGLAEPRLNARIIHVGARALLDSATRAAAYYARGGARVFASGMLEALNKGVHKKFELPA